MDAWTNSPFWTVYESVEGHGEVEVERKGKTVTSAELITFIRGASGIHNTFRERIDELLNAGLMPAQARETLVCEHPSFFFFLTSI
jgi:hypothetical protein